MEGFGSIVSSRATRLPGLPSGRLIEHEVTLERRSTPGLSLVEISPFGQGTRGWPLCWFEEDTVKPKKPREGMIFPFSVYQAQQV